MISLFKHFDNSSERRPEKREPEPAPRSPYRAILSAIQDSIPRAVPGVGGDLEQRLSEIHQTLDSDERKEKLDRASSEVREQLRRWSDDALRHHSDNERELREIIGVVSRAAESVGQRDEKYSKEIGGFTGKLRSIADQRDLAAVRRSILESATALNACVERMTEESRASTRMLATEVAEYRKRLEESEKAASVDALTNLVNRRGFERQMEVRMRLGKIFSLILIDLNKFKLVNDQHGHLAGDDLLRKFSKELRERLVPADVVARWGGDEFAVIVDGDSRLAEARVGAIQEWVFGDYWLRVGETTAKVMVTGSIGIAQWDGSELAAALLERADRAVYKGKEQSRGPERRDSVRRAEDRPAAPRDGLPAGPATARAA